LVRPFVEAGALPKNILVCDMPAREIWRPQFDAGNFVAANLDVCIGAKTTGQKNDPGKPGSFVESSVSGTVPERKNRSHKRRIRKTLKAGIGQVAVPYCNARAGHQPTVDGSHKPTERADCWDGVKRSGFGHFGPPSGEPRRAAMASGANLGIPDASSNLSYCMAPCILLQRDINETIEFPNSNPNNKKAAGMTGGL
jgi:hypothetical protein